MPYTYLWSDGSTDEDLSNVASGNYSVTINDLDGCATVRDYFVGQPQPFTLTPDIGDAGETVSVIAIGNGTTFIPGFTTCIELTNGTETYSFDGTASSASGFIANLDLPADAPGGFYDVNIYGGPGCSGMLWPCEDCFFICSPISVTGVAMDASCAICTDGLIDLTVSGGTPPYTFSWSNNSQVEDPTGLEAGDYSVTVTDIGGCAATAMFTIDEPDPITVNPSNANPGSSNSIIITGVGTNFVPGMTTCAEISDGSNTYQITGNATNIILFNGNLNLPLGAVPGLYDVTIYEGPDCSGMSWSCTDCFTINEIFNCGATVLMQEEAMAITPMMPMTPGQFARMLWTKL